MVAWYEEQRAGLEKALHGHHHAVLECRRPAMLECHHPAMLESHAVYARNDLGEATLVDGISIAHMRTCCQP